MTAKDTVLHFKKRRLAEIPKLAIDLKKQGRKIISIVAKRSGDS